MPIDTRRFVRCLTASGFTEQQAETPADGHVALLNGNPAAVKADVPEWLVCGAPIVQGGLIVTPSSCSSAARAAANAAGAAIC